jgi:foldase protein PrsA
VKTRILLSVIALALAGCGSGNAVVATVNDADITKTLVDELRSAEVVSKADYANDIRDSIFEHLLTKAAQTEYGFTVVESDAEARYQELVSQVVAGNGTTYEQFLTDQGITDARVRRAASQQVLREAVEARLLPEITDDEVRDAFDKSPGEQFTVCSKHILSATADEATEIISMLSHGSDFAELAVEFSTDPTAADTGGDLGCNPASLWRPTSTRWSVRSRPNSVSMSLSCSTDRSECSRKPSRPSGPPSTRPEPKSRPPNSSTGSMG